MINCETTKKFFSQLKIKKFDFNRFVEANLNLCILNEKPFRVYEVHRFEIKMKNFEKTIARIAQDFVKANMLKMKMILKLS